MNATRIDELSVQALFAEDRYRIPIYQRNYAWGESEVEQLLQDVLDMARQQPDGHYYLGSLVVSGGDGVPFDIIDGQQRHTTLCLVLAALRHTAGATLTLPELNLGFAQRPASEATLASLYRDGTPPVAASLDPAMWDAYTVARRFLQREQASVALLVPYLLRQVRLLRVAVPRSTDLNHYFEVMNNRGEQLERHEVLKASLMARLPDARRRDAFALVWDACADMQRHVQMGFAREARTRLFGPDWSGLPASFDVLCEAVAVPDTDALTLQAIIDSARLSSTAPRMLDDGDARSAAVIDFPNFLLHVLRCAHGAEVALDDKRLLDAFAAHPPDPEAFALNLLTCRLLLDRYVVRRTEDANWHLSRCAPDGYRASFAQDSTALRMLLAMFHVSYPAQSYKRWLGAALSYLFGQWRADQPIACAAYQGHMEQVARSMLRDEACGSTGLPDPARMRYDSGVRNFVFNWLDFLLWKRLMVNDLSLFDGMDVAAVRRHLPGFRFTQRSSIEHHYPQHPVDDAPLPAELLHAFGNLYLIHAGHNSTLSNDLPGRKCMHYQNAGAIPSLKQACMMSYGAQWGPAYPHHQATHEAMMLAVLRSDLTS